MKIKTQLTLAAVLAAGMLASGCSQMAAQQTAAAPAPAAETKVVNDCSQCKKPAAPAPKAIAGGAHTHPAIPGCTDSTMHNHPSTNPKHQHAYSCKGGKKKPAKPAVVKPVKPIAPRKPVAPVKPVAPKVVVPKVKAKGTYKGPITIDQGVMKQYQQ